MYGCCIWFILDPEATLFTLIVTGCSKQYMRVQELNVLIVVVYNDASTGMRVDELQPRCTLVQAGKVGSEVSKRRLGGVGAELRKGEGVCFAMIRRWDEAFVPVASTAYRLLVLPIRAEGTHARIGVA